MAVPVGQVTMDNVPKCAICEKPAPHQCSACQKVFYCSKEHQKTGWQTHKKECVPYKICHDDKLGYHLVAARKIEEGQQVVEDIPLIMGPRQGGGAVCLSCLEPIDSTNFRNCRKCDWTLCGSEDCHNNPIHKPECYYIMKRKADESLSEFQFNTLLYDGIVILRCLHLKQFAPDLWEKFMKLRSGGENIKKTTLYDSAKKMLLKIIHNSFGLKDEFSEEEIMKVWAILKINEYRLAGDKAVASVIYEMNSYFENNCRANCYRTVTTDARCIIVAGKDIAKGEHLSLSYASPLWTTINRQRYFQQNKYFTCRCERCTDVTEFGTNFSSYKCQRKNCDGISLPESFLTKDSQWTCNKCKFKTQATVAEKIFKHVEQDFAKIVDTSAAYKAFLASHKKLLPETHSLIISAKLHLIFTLGHIKEGGIIVLSHEDIMLKKNLCREVINLLDIIAPAEKSFKIDMVQELRVLLKETIRRLDAATAAAESSNTIEERKSILDETEQLLKSEEKIEKLFAIMPKPEHSLKRQQKLEQSQQVEEQKEQVLTDTEESEQSEGEDKSEKSFKYEEELKEEGKDEEKPKHEETTKQVPKVEEEPEKSDNAEGVPEAAEETEQMCKGEEKSEQSQKDVEQREQVLTDKGKTEQSDNVEVLETGEKTEQESKDEENPKEVPTSEENPEQGLIELPVVATTEQTQKCAVCNEPAEHRCSACQKVFYCSKDHQKTGWKKHKKNCVAYKICHDDKLGYHLVAARKIEEGQQITEDIPLIMGPRQGGGAVCLSCLEPIDSTNFRNCRKCDWTLCSSEDCHNNPIHKPECYYIMKRKADESLSEFQFNTLLYDGIVILRCLHLKQFAPNLWEKFMKLRSGGENIKKTTLYDSARKMLLKIIHNSFGLKDEFSEEEIMKVWAILKINEYPLAGDKAVASVIYEMNSYFENNCRANCYRTVTTDARCIIVAGKDIAKGEHLSLSYASPLWTTINRQRYFQQNKYFTCRCERCTDVTEFGTNFSSCKCQRKNCDGISRPESFLTKNSQWTCNKCKFKTQATVAEKIFKHVEQDFAKIVDTSAAYKAFLASHKKLLPETHSLIISAKLPLIFTIGHIKEGGIIMLSHEDIMLKKNLCREVINLLDIIAPAEKHFKIDMVQELRVLLKETSRRLDAATAAAESSNTIEERKSILDETEQLLKSAEKIQKLFTIMPKPERSLKCQEKLERSQQVEEQREQVLTDTEESEISEDEDKSEKSFKYEEELKEEAEDEEKPKHEETTKQVPKVKEKPEQSDNAEEVPEAEEKREQLQKGTEQREQILTDKEKTEQSDNVEVLEAGEKTEQESKDEENPREVPTSEEEPEQGLIALPVVVITEQTQKCAVCNEPAEHRCSACQKVFYCSKAHQKTGWKKHKKNCVAYKICHDDKLGYHLVAARKIEEGQQITEDIPLIMGPRQGGGAVCLSCLEPIDSTNFRNCRKCDWTLCSSEDCHNNPIHKPECYYIMKRKADESLSEFQFNTLLYDGIVILRCLHLKQFAPNLWEKFMKLRSGGENIKKTTLYDSARKMLLKIIHNSFGLKDEFSEEEIMKVWTILKINEYPLAGDKAVASVIYEMNSYFENNCRANCYRTVTTDARCIIVAGKDIAKGEHLSLSYASPLWTTINRQRYFQQNKYFTCRCERCTDVTEFGTNFSSCKCQRKNCDGISLPESFLTKNSQWTCNKCKFKTQATVAEKIFKHVEQDFAKIVDTSAAYKAFLVNHKKLLPETHSLIISAKLPLIFTIGHIKEGGIIVLSHEDIMLKKNLCREVINLLDIIAPAEKNFKIDMVQELRVLLKETSRRLDAATAAAESSNTIEERKSILDETEQLLKSAEKIEKLFTIMPKPERSLKCQEKLERSQQVEEQREQVLTDTEESEISEDEDKSEKSFKYEEELKEEAEDEEKPKHEETTKQVPKVKEKPEQSDNSEEVPEAEEKREQLQKDTEQREQILTDKEKTEQSDNAEVLEAGEKTEQESKDEENPRQVPTSEEEPEQGLIALPVVVITEQTQTCAVCNEPAEHRCSACQKVFYCSKAHQKSDWQKHKKDCVPYKICNDDKLGYHLVAVRNIEEGKKLVDGMPFIIGPRQGGGVVCLSCLKPIDTANFCKCSKCGWKLCNTEDCRNSSQHDPECYYTRKRKADESLGEFQLNNSLYDGIIILRCLYRKQFAPNLWEKFMKLRSGGEKIKRTTLYDSAKKTLLKIIHNSFGLKDEFTEEEIMKVWAILQINGSYLAMGKAVATVIYEMRSYFEHNCRANCHNTVAKEGNCIILAGKDIAKGDHLTLCCAYPLSPTINRQRYLQQNKYFTCRCERCTDVTEFGTNFSSYKCQRKNCDGISLPESFLTTDSQWTCNKCKFKKQGSAAEKIFKHVEQDLSKITEDTSAVYKAFLTRHKKLLPETHAFIINAKLSLAYMLGHAEEGGMVVLSHEDIILKRDLCREVISLLDIIAPAEKRFKIDMVEELRAVLKETNRRLGAAGTSADSSITLEEDKSMLDETEQLLKGEEEIDKLITMVPKPEHSLKCEEKPEQSKKIEKHSGQVLTDKEKTQQSDNAEEVLEAEEKTEHVSKGEKKDKQSRKRKKRKGQILTDKEKPEQSDSAEVLEAEEKTEQMPKDEEEPEQLRKGENQSEQVLTDKEETQQSDNAEEVLEAEEKTEHVSKGEKKDKQSRKRKKRKGQILTDKENPEQSDSAEVLEAEEKTEQMPKDEEEPEQLRKGENQSEQVLTDKEETQQSDNAEEVLEAEEKTEQMTNDEEESEQSQKGENLSEQVLTDKEKPEQSDNAERVLEAEEKTEQMPKGEKKAKKSRKRKKRKEQVLTDKEKEVLEAEEKTEQMPKDEEELEQSRKGENQSEQILTDNEKTEQSDNAEEVLEAEEKTEQMPKDEERPEQSRKGKEQREQVLADKEKSEQSDNAEEVPEAGEETEQEPKDDENPNQVSTSEEQPEQGLMVLATVTTPEQTQNCAVCAKPTQQRCSACQKVFYCSKEHQKTGWEEHKNDCVPYKICNDDKLGYHVVAIREIEEGEEIDHGIPFIIGPRQGGGIVCLSCLKPIDTANFCKCSKCGWKLCNSEECRNSSHHEPECYYTIKRRSDESLPEFQFNSWLYDGIMILRCLYLKQSSPSVWERFIKLKSGGKKLKKTALYDSAKKALLKIIHNSFSLKDEFSEEEIMKVWAIVKINEYRLTAGKVVATVIYEMSSYFENNCRANCYRTATNEGNCIITAGKDIAKADHLSLCYAFPLSSTINRQRYLQQNKYFTCRCERCTDVTEFGTNFSSYKCQRKKCDGIALPESFLTKNSQWTCNKCKFKAPASVAEKIFKHVEQDLSKIEQETSAVYKAFWARHKKLLPETHSFMINAKLSLACTLGQTEEGGMVVLSHEDMMLKKNVCREVINVVDIVAPAERRIKIDMVLQLRRVLKETNRRLDAAGTAADSSISIEEFKLILDETEQILKSEEKPEQSQKVEEQSDQVLTDKEKTEQILEGEDNTEKSFKDEEKPGTSLKKEEKADENLKHEETVEQMPKGVEKPEQSGNAKEVPKAETTEQERKDKEKPKQLLTSEEQLPVATPVGTQKCDVCKKPAEHQCSACQKVFYCSKEHQKIGWKKHKEDCILYKICNDDKLGYHLVAARNIEEGKEIVREMPFVMGPQPGGGNVCVSCWDPIDITKFRTCKKCGWMLCGYSECHNNTDHRPECYYTTKRKANESLPEFQFNSLLYDGIMVLRCLYRKQFAPSLWEKFMKLRSGGEKIKRTASYDSAKKTLLKIIHNSFALKDEFSEEEIMKVWAILKINEYQQAAGKAVASIIYEMNSYLVNNCRANCYRTVTAGGRCLIIAGKNIAKGEHLSLPYAYPLWTTINRQRYLTQNKYFTCRCERCTDVTEFGTNFSSYKCRRKNCDGISLPESFLTKDSPWTCNKCKFKTQASVAEKIFKHVEQDYLKIKIDTSTVYKEYLARHKQLLPETQSFIINAKLPLIFRLGHTEEGGMEVLSHQDILLKKKLCAEVIDLLDIIAPAEKKIRIDMVLELENILIETTRRLDAAEESADSSIMIEERKTIVDETKQLLKREEKIKKLIMIVPKRSITTTEQSQNVEEQEKQILADEENPEKPPEEEAEGKAEENIELEVNTEQLPKGEEKAQQTLKDEENSKEVPKSEEQFEQVTKDQEIPEESLPDQVSKAEETTKQESKDEEKSEQSLTHGEKPEQVPKTEEKTEQLSKGEESTASKEQ